MGVVRQRFAGSWVATQGGRVAIFGLGWMVIPFGLACSKPVDGQDWGFGEGGGQVTAVDSASETGASASEGGESGATGESGASASSGSADGSTSGASGTTDSISDTGSESGASGDATDPGQGLVCEDPGGCGVGLDLGSVSGDQGSPVLSHGGSEPIWVTFEVREDDGGIGGEELRFTATLVSPAGIDFDLYVYRGNGTGCGASTSATSTEVGALDSVSMSWGEGSIANGSDDSEYVAINIVPKGAVCDPSEVWQLTVEGDT